MCANKIISIDSRRDHPAEFCAELFDAAEREMAAFVSSVDQLFDHDMTQQAADYWIEVLETLNPFLDKTRPNWRQVTIAAAARLAKGFNLAPLSFVSQSAGDSYVPQDISVRLKNKSLSVSSDKASSGLQLLSKMSAPIDRDTATLECGQRSDDALSALREVRALLEDKEKQLRQAKGKLRDAEPLLIAGNVAQSISHDLRNHLAVIYANVELISDLAAHRLDRAELLGEVRATIREIIDMLDSLTLSRHAGRSMHSSWASLNHVIEHAMTMVKNHPDARGVEFAVHGKKILEGWIDCSVLGSAIYNLLVNACQAVTRVLPPRKVRVTLSEIEGSIYIRVMDNGPGVSAAIRETLFQPFVSVGRADNIGLGLTIAERAARQLGGFLDLETSSPGNTVFAMYFSALAFMPRSEDMGAQRYEDSRMAYRADPR
jgi:signal transduction histidine kinase